MTFGIKEKSIILNHTVYFLAIATNIAIQLKTGFVLQGHIVMILVKTKSLNSLNVFFLFKIH